MHIHTRNINTAFNSLVGYFDGQRDRLREAPVVRRNSRNGPVLMIDEPVTITYSHPRERCLFNAARDVNPFSQLYEALWMLAGRNDVAPLAYYTKRFTADYSDDGRTLNGAYGRRWRNKDVLYSTPVVMIDGFCQGGPGSKRIDQLKILIDHLHSSPESRRAVLQMWNVEDDLLKIDTSKDVCCNLSVMFSLREVVKGHPHGPQALIWFLDITVVNRSNDMIWGMLNANYVTFSVLQEYVAAHLGAEVGLYHHFTNNLHVYESNWEPEEWLNEHEAVHDQYLSIEDGSKFAQVPFVKDPMTFDRELIDLVEQYSNGDNGPPKMARGPDYSEPFFRDVACLMFNAFRLYKHKLYDEAIGEASLIRSDDWRILCQQWLTKRAKEATK